jgi:hypothetical protein
MSKSTNLPTDQETAPRILEGHELHAVTGGCANNLATANTARPPLAAKLDRCFVKSWSTSGDAD